MVMVPETEYYGLLSALRGGDYLQGEKASLDAEIMKNLENPHIKPEVKAQKHAWLYKERRTVKELAENKPQKVVIENMGPPPNIAPYMGISTPNNAEKSEDPKKLIVSQSRLKAQVPSISISGSEDETMHTPTSTKFFESPSKPSLIHPKLYNYLLQYVSANMDNFKITAEGKVQTNTMLPISDSSYKDVLSYLTGGTDQTPRGTKFLKDRLLKDQKIREMVNASKDMWGEGKRKRVLVNIKGIKTIGIERNSKPFKPTIWAKL